MIVIPRLALRRLRHAGLSAELCAKLCEFPVGAITKLAPVLVIESPDASSLVVFWSGLHLLQI